MEAEKSQNPMQYLQQASQSNPAIAKAMQAAQGKDTQQMNELISNTINTTGMFGNMFK